MPELPEVETICRTLRKTLPGRKIDRIRVRDPRLRWPVDETRLQQLVLGQKVIDIDRRAKYLLIRFEQESRLVIHLGMSGRLLLLTESPPFEKHDHVIFYLDNNTELRFRDPRRFGMVDAIPPGGLETYPRFINLGVEPLAPETRSEALFEKCHNWKRPIKNLLMDGSFMVGVGNIYASESLFYAGIHPKKASNMLSKKDWANLFLSIQNVLNQAIEKGGTTLNDFVDSNGEVGYFQLSLAVYGREGQKCRRCQSLIERYVQVGRSTYFCPGCQD
ncbi:bifunctional DNA-formamidopyrimidine glycosylase/DNA-(apurinic or apyrimidinic site) lyase [candidate division KSB1 bacterium]|nr:bifunctional DNA-formamidopyrimidine glycosylase/DNA-(apurinic or apyrimidinic site) lyase [candidate division KSB1 bacterium]